MLNFKQFIAEEKTLNIFDIDDTLLRTTAKVMVMKDDKVVTKLSNQQFNTYKLKPGEHFDFTEFADSEKFFKTSKPMMGMLQKAKAILGNMKPSSKMIFVTARTDFDDKKKVLATFRKFGFPIDKVYIERAGNIVNAKKTSAAIAKAYIVRKYLSKTGYDKIRMYDDAPKNLDMINKLKKLNKDVSLDLHLVTPSGNIKKYK